MAYTRAQFRDLIRQRLGWSATDTFVTDAEMNNYINDGLLELHSLLATVYRPGQWGVIDLGATVGAGANFCILTFTDFARLVKVTILYNQQLVPLQAGDYTVDVVSTLQTPWTPWNVRYYLQIASANSLVFSRPTPQNQALTVTYLRSAPVFSSDADTSWMGWDEYVVLDCMIKCRNKEEADVSSTAQEKEQLQQRIRFQAEPLDMGRAATVQDLRALDMQQGNAELNWWRRW